MSDEATTPLSTDQKEPLQATDLPINIHTQFIRDLSFENPNAPDTLRSSNGMPDMDVKIGMDARSLEDDDIKSLYEVALTISAHATKDEKTVFLTEIIYSVVVSVGDVVPEEQHHALLLIEVPKFSFPFVRQILSTVTSQGGYPPLLLNPVDFQALYMDRFKEEIEEAKKAAEQGKTN